LSRYNVNGDYTPYGEQVVLNYGAEVSTKSFDPEVSNSDSKTLQFWRLVTLTAEFIDNSRTKWINFST